VKITRLRDEIQLFGGIQGIKILSAVGILRPSLLLYYSLDSIERGMHCDEEEIKASYNWLRRAGSVIVHRAKGE
jgi:hypothetical protein